MDRGGCGCFGFALAIIAGLALGLAGLGAAGYYYLDRKILSDQELNFAVSDWNAGDETVLSAKLVPFARALRNRQEFMGQVSLTEREADRLLESYGLNELGAGGGEVVFGDTAMTVEFSRPLKNGKFLNGELRAGIAAENGDFEVAVYKFRTGEYTWPRFLDPAVRYWLEYLLDTQRLFKKQPWRMLGFSLGPGECRLTIKVLPEKIEKGNQ